MSQVTVDRLSTGLQTGEVFLVGTLAEALAACDQIALDPKYVIVHGRLTVREDRP